MATFYGSSDPDSLSGTEGSDQFYGSPGDDTLAGLGGSDSLQDTDGANVLYGDGTDPDAAEGGNDVLVGGTSNALYGGAGDDVLHAAGSSTLAGGSGNDYLDGGGNTNQLEGGSGNDRITGTGTIWTDSAGDATRVGGDVLVADLGTAQAFGIYDVQDFKAGPGGDVLNLHELLADLVPAGFDFRNPLIDMGQFAATGARVVNGTNSWMRLVQNGADVQVEVDPSGPGNGSSYQAVIVLRGVTLASLAATNFDPPFSLDGQLLEPNPPVFGSGRILTLDGDDVVVDTGSYWEGQGTANSQVNTGYGNDRISLNGGADTVYAGTGNDTIDGTSSAGSRFYGEAGDDRITLSDGGTAEGGDGQDILAGGQGHDTFYGGQGEDLLTGGGADDVLVGNAGRDTLDGGTGRDYLDGSEGDDRLTAGVANVVYSSNPLTGYAVTFDELATGPFEEGDYLAGGADSDTLIAGAGDDRLDDQQGANIIFGGSGNDTITAGVSNWVDAGTGDDYLSVHDSSTVSGGEGRDTLQLYGLSIQADAGAGDDTVLMGDASRFASGVITLGSGSDTVVIGARALGNGSTPVDVTDFVTGPGGDRLDVNGLLGGLVNYGFGNPFLGGFLRLHPSADGPDTWLQVDVSGPGDGANWQNVALLRNTSPGAFTHDNFLPPRLYPAGNARPELYTGTEVADTYVGIEGGDSIRGQGGHDFLDGGFGGNDTIEGGAGRDTLYGFDGDDVLYGDSQLAAGGDDSDVIFGGFGDDLIHGGGGSDNEYVWYTYKGIYYGWQGGLDGGAGNDTIFGGDGSDSLLGQDGNDFLDGGTGGDGIYGGIGSDTLLGGEGDDYLHDNGNFSDRNLLEGGAGADNLYSTGGDDTLDGGAGNDILNGYNARGVLRGGAGNDDLSANHPGGVYLLDGGDDNDRLQNSPSSAETGGDTLLGGAGNDRITLLGTDNAVAGGAGADFIDLEYSTAWYYAGTGQVYLADLPGGASPSDTDTDVVRLSLRAVEGGRAAPEIHDFHTGAGGDKLDLNAVLGRMAERGYSFGNPFTTGWLRLQQDGADTRLQADLSEGRDGSGWSDLALLRSVDVSTEAGMSAMLTYNFTTSFGVDGVSITGTDADETISDSVPFEGVSPGDGGDSVRGEGGNDFLDGGFGGNDTLVGGAGRDTVFGFDGDDVLFGDGQDDGIEGNADVIFGGAGNDLIHGGGGHDSEYVWFTYKGVYYGWQGGLDGGAGDDTIYGGDGNDWLFGQEGDDSLEGGEGADGLYGAAGSDTLVGGGGDDYLHDGSSGPSRNLLQGGDGNDNLYATGSDDTLEGGEGNDTLDGYHVHGTLFGGGGNDVLNANNYLGSYLLDGGDGNDRLQNTLSSAETGGDTLLGGAGDDHFLVLGEGNLVAAGAGADFIDLEYSTAWYYAGTGQIYLADLPDGETPSDTDIDTVRLSLRGPEGERGAPRIHDFHTGAGGDRIDLNVVLGRLAEQGYDFSNPFTSGWLRLVQDGADARLQADVSGPADGASWLDIGVFAGTQAAGFTEDNFTPRVSPIGLGTGLTIVGTDEGDTISDSVAMAGLYTGDGSDVVRGEAGHDFLDGGFGGNDTLVGGGGRDTVFGFAGDDVLYGDTQDDSATGDRDVVFGGAGDDVIHGGDGDDNEYVWFTYKGVYYGWQGALSGGPGNDTIYGEDGSDSLFGGEGNDSLDGGADADALYGSGGDDTLVGGAGNDYLHDDSQGTSRNLLQGGSGSDNLFSTGAFDTLDGGDDNDVVSTSAANATVLGGSGDDHLEGTHWAGTYLLDGGEGHDWIGNAQTSSEIGRDTLVGGAGNDHILVVGTGNVVAGGSGADFIDLEFAAAWYYAGAGEVYLADLPGGAAISDADIDTVRLSLRGAEEGRIARIHDFHTGPGGDRLDLNAVLGRFAEQGYIFDNPFTTGWLRLVQDGADTRLQADASGPANGAGWIDLAVMLGTQASAFTHDNFAPTVSPLGLPVGQSLAGTALDESLTESVNMQGVFASDGADSISGLGGNDFLDGGFGGADTLVGGIGRDTLYGFGGDDVLYGDTQDNSATGDRDVIFGGAGNDLIFGGDGDDNEYVWYTYKGVYYGWQGALSGGPGNDTIFGGDGADSLFGGEGNDWLDGGADADALYGAAGNDTLLGGAANDTLHDDGGARNLLQGGTGADTLTSGGADDTLEGGEDNDTLNTYALLAVLRGESGDDELAGNRAEGTYLIEGGEGNDALHNAYSSAESGADTLLGGAGGDRITVVGLGNLVAGGSGGDVIDLEFSNAWYYSGSGQVYLGDQPGAGPAADGETDVVRVSLRGVEASRTAARIHGFETGIDGDQMDLSAVTSRLAEWGWAAGTDPFASGHLRLTAAGANTLLEADVDAAANGERYITVAVFVGTDPDAFISANVLQVFDPQVSDNAAAPVIDDDKTVVVPEDTSVALGIAGPVDPDGGTLTISVIGLPQYGQVTLADGTVVANGQQLSTGELTGLRYVTQPNHFGPAAMFRYTVADDEGSVQEGQVQVRVTNVNDAPYGTLNIYGTPLLGETLYAGYNFGDADGLGSFVYQWYANEQEIPTGTGQTLSLTAAEIGKAIKVTVTYLDGGGTVESVTSAATAVVVDPNNSAPEGALTIVLPFGAEVPKQGDTLSVLSTISDADGMGVLTYQWLADGAPIPGATGDTFTLTPEHVAKAISVRGSYVDGGGKQESVDSVATALVDVGRNAYSVIGTPGEDMLQGSVDNDDMFGLQGDDWLYAYGGDDLLLGGLGYDRLLAGLGNDTLVGGEGTSGDELYGQEGDDYLELVTGYAEGGSGNDTMFAVAGSTGGGVVLYGGEGADLLVGGVYADYLAGGNDDDWLEGHEGDDNMRGEQGNDTLIGADGNEYMQAGEGNDVLDGGAGNDTLFSGETWGDNDDLLLGGSGNDVFIDGGGRNMLEGGEGDDRFELGSWNPETSNLVTGGSGRDTYVLTSNASNLTITDFEAGAGGDILHIDAMLNASSGYSGGNPFGEQGYLRLVQEGADALLQWDRDGASGSSYGWHTEVRLQGFDASALNGTNFSPFTPTDGSETGLLVIGTPDNDTLLGSVVDDEMQGLAGDDWLYAYGGDDLLLGGLGYDRLLAGLGNDTLIGGEGTSGDELYGQEGDDYLELVTGYAEGGSGNDTMFAVAGSTGGGVVLYGGEGADLLVGGVYADYLAGGNDDDWLEGHEGDDNMRGEQGNDTLIGADGNEYMQAGEGNDVLDGGAGNDTLFSGETWGDNDDLLLGGSGNDVFIDGGGRNMLEGGEGDDRFELGSWNPETSNLVTGGSGRDTYVLTSNASNLTITDFEAGAGGDILHIDAMLNASSGYSGGNPFGEQGYLRLVQEGADALLQWDRDGASGSSYGWHTEVRLQGFDASALNGTNFSPFTPTDGSETGLLVIGTPDNDTLLGSVVDDEMQGLAGDDWLYAYGGDDLLLGGLGYDRLLAGLGNDTLIGGEGTSGDELYGQEGDDYLELVTGYAEGGSGNDTMFAVAGSTGGGVVLYGGEGADLLVGGVYADYLAGGNDDDWLEGHEGDDNMRGEQGNDTLIGADGNEYMQAGEGNDVLDGGAGNDTLFSGETWGDNDDLLLGGSGNDVFIDGGGRNTLEGGEGDDRFELGSWSADASNLVTGGSGRDTYVLTAETSNLTITDFEAGPGGDILHIDAMLNASSGYTGGNPFGEQGYLRLVQDGNDAVLQWDRDGALGTSYGWQTQARLQSLDAAALTVDNLVPTIPALVSLNAAPVLVNRLSGARITEDSYFSFQFAADAFRDPDPSDSLTYSARLTDGSALPGWLVFTAASRTFSGYGGDTTGYLEVEVIARDSVGASASDHFTLTVDNVNDAPTGNVYFDGDAVPGATLFAADTLMDVDGIDGFIRFHWRADGQDIDGATGSTFPVSAADVGKAISVVASYTDHFGTFEAVESGSVIVQAPPANTAPTFYTPALPGTGIVSTDMGGADFAERVLIQPDGKILVAGSVWGSGVHYDIARYNADGSLDTSFNGSGIVESPIKSGTNATAMALQWDGKILLAGYSEDSNHFAVMRYNADGSVDTGFDGSHVAAAFPGMPAGAEAIAVQPDGRIVIAGQVWWGDGNVGVVRLNQDGTLDTTFNGSGYRMEWGGGDDRVHSVSVGWDGSIVVAGATMAAGTDILLVRLTPDGNADWHFNAVGWLASDLTGAIDYGMQAVLQADGKILVAGYSDASGSLDFQLARYNSDGSLDLSFGDGMGYVLTDVGNASTDLGRALTLTPDGKIVVAGNSGVFWDDFAVARYNSDGSLDTSFNGTGIKVTTDSVVDVPYAVTAQADGKVVAVGYSNERGNDFALVRYDTNGNLDSSFGATPAGETVNGVARYAIGGTPVLLDRSVMVFDAELAASGNYAGASITLSRSGGADGHDQYHALGRMAFSGTNVLLGDVLVGSVVQGGGVLSIDFNANATQAGVNEVLSSIGYSNATAQRVESVQIDWLFSDGSVPSAATVLGSSTVDIELGPNTAPTFAGPGRDGQVKLDFSSNEAVRSAVLQADGKIVFTGYGSDGMFQLARVNTDGTPDTTFNGTGHVLTSVGSGDSRSMAVALQDDGKLVVAGDTAAGIALVRYNADGSLDASFDADGKAEMAFAGSSLTGARTLAMQADGKMLVGGFYYEGSVGRNFVIRFSADGSVDTTFLGTGLRALEDGGGFGLTKVLVQTDGKVVLAGGRSTADGNSDFAVARLTADGRLDTSFNGTGVMRTDMGSRYDSVLDAVLQPDGKIVLAGAGYPTGPEAAVLARYNSDGSLDTSFNGTGKVVTDLANGSAWSVGVDADGKIVIAGRGAGGGDYAVARYNANGSLDSSFNGSGVVTTDFGANEAAYAVITQSNGQVVLLGMSHDGTNGDMALVRYKADGSLDTSYGIDTLGGTTTYVRGDAPVLLDDSVSIFDAELAAAGSYGGATITLYRHGGYSEDDNFHAMGQLSLSGSDVMLAGGVVGDFVQIPGALVIGFNANATQATVNQVLSSIGYSNNGAGEGETFQIEWSFADSTNAYALMATGLTTVTIAAAPVNAAPTFSTPGVPGTGIVTTDMGAYDYAERVVMQPDGKILVAGSVWGATTHYEIARYNPDGVLDITFNGTGKVVSDIKSGSDATAMALQPDGKILLAGYTPDGAHFAVTRFQADGTVDAAFDGSAISAALPDYFGGAEAIAVQADGRIVVAGQLWGMGGDVGVVRLNADGTLDTTFNGVGYVHVDAGGDERVQSVLVQADGSIVVAGSSTLFNTDFLLVRLTPDGMLDYGFDMDGVVVADLTGAVDYAMQAVLQADGNILVAGYSNLNADYDFALARFTPYGTLDLSFGGGDGYVLTGFDAFSTDIGRSLALTPQGKIVVAGNTGSFWNDFAVARYNADGSLDTSFNGSGLSFTTFGVADVPYAVTVQQDGKIVAVGVADTVDDDFALVRFNVDGSLDTGFGGIPAGDTVNGTATYTLQGAPVLLDTLVRVFDAELAASGNYAGASLTLSRTGGADARDQFHALGRMTFDGSKVWLGDAVVGSVVQDSGLLHIDFNGNATQPRVNEVLSSIGYSNPAAPGAQSLSFDWLFSDGAGADAASVVGASTVNIVLPPNAAPTFFTPDIRDDDGEVTIDYGQNQQVWDAAVQPDGKILLTGAVTQGDRAVFQVARLNANGTLDTSFNGNGSVLLPVGSYASSQSVLLQADGKVVIAGDVAGGIGLARFNADGRQDPGFGGDGVVTTALAGFQFTGIRSATLQADGKVLVGGFGMTSQGVSQVVVARYDLDGNLDASFGADGLQALQIGGTRTFASKILVQADGKILLAGASNTGASDDLALMRLNADGSVDSSFNGSGIVTTDFGGNRTDNTLDAVLQPDGKIILVGVSYALGSEHAAIARYNADGSLDTSFNGTGRVITDLGGSDSAWAVRVQGDGKIVIGGRVGNGTDYVVARYNTDGSLDASFNGTGIATVDRGSMEGGYALVLQPDGRIVLLGNTARGMESDMSAIRLNADGSFDTSFGTAPGVDTLGSAVTYKSGTAPVLLDGSVAVFDADLAAAGSYAGASITLQRAGGPDADDQFHGLGNLAFGNIGVFLGDQEVGSYLQQIGLLYIEFNANASQSVVNEVLSSIGYSNSGDLPPQQLQIEWIFSDNTDERFALKATGTTTVDIVASNNAPVLDMGTPIRISTSEDVRAAWTVREIMAGHVSDTDSSDVGIVVTGANSRFGPWQYSLDGGASWQAVAVTGPVPAAPERGLLLGPDAMLQVTPGPDFNGDLTQALSFRAWDRTEGAEGTYADLPAVGGSSAFSAASGLATLDVKPVQDAVPDSVTVDEDASVTVSVFANDGFASPVHNIAWAGEAAHGTVSIVNAALGTVRYTPVANYHGSDSFTYAVITGVGTLNDAATVSVTVTAVNDLTVFGGARTGSVNEDAGVLTGTLTVADDDGVTNPGFAVTTAAVHGLASINASTGAWTYTPVADYNGSDSFTVRVTDDDGNVATQVISLAVASVVDIFGDSISVAEDESVTSALLANDSFEGTGAVITAAGGASNGTVSIVNAATGAVKYTPDANYFGSDSYSYTVSSGGVTETGTVSVTVNGRDDPMSFSGALSGRADEDTAITGTLAVSDIDGVANARFMLLVDPTHGAARIDHASGAWTYTSAADFAGSDSFQVAVFDDQGNATSLLIPITVDAVPDIQADTATVAEDGLVNVALLGNDNFESSARAVTATGLAGHGTVAIVDAAQGLVRYTPDANYHGADSFSYTVTSGAVTETATVSVDVSSVDDPTVFGGNTSGSGSEDGGAIGGKLTATDVDGLSAPAFTVTTNAQHGAASIGAQGAWSYLANADFNGADSFTVSVRDDEGRIATRVISVAVNAVVDVANDSVSVAEDGSVTSALLANDSFEGSAAITALTQGSHGTVRIVNSSQVAYTPAGDYFGADSYTYTVTSGGVTETATVTINVTPVNDAPTGVVIVSGQLLQGATLNASNTLADVDGIPASGVGAVQYQWLADGAAIQGATGNSLVLTQQQVGTAVTVRASYTDLSGTVESVTSSASGLVQNVNDAPTGAVGFAGGAVQGQTLVASNTLADLDGLGTVTYQWLADGQVLPGQTGATLTLTQAQVGKAISLRASYTDGFGTLEHVTSGATGPVANVNDAPTGGLAISGTPLQGQVLALANTIADEDGTGAFDYQWFADGVAIAGATGGSLALTQAEVGTTITARARYTDGFGVQESVTSTATAAVGNVNDAPTGTVSISGTPAQGQVLSASHTLADADGMGTVSWQWLADGAAIAGATGASFTLGQAQVGKSITARGSYTDGFGAAQSVTSAGTSAVANVNDAPVGAVTLSGSALQGQVLTAAVALADADGLGTFSYQWFADGAAIEGATGASFTLGQQQVGKAVSARVSYTDGFGAVESVDSAAGAVVANVNDAATGSVSIDGVAQQGEVLTASSAMADLDGLGAISYQWLADGLVLQGQESNTLAMTQAHVGKAISVRASFNDGFGHPESLTSAATTAVVNVNDAPTGMVTLSGSAMRCESLVAAALLADADGMGTIRYQWLADGVAIAGATSDTFTLSLGQVGKAVSVQASYVDGYGHAESVTSAPTAAVGDFASGTLHGMAYHWKSHALLGGVTVQATDTRSAVASATDLLDLRDMQFDTASNTVTVQLWAKPAGAAASLDFTVRSLTADGITFNSALGSGWTVESQADGVSTLRVGAILDESNGAQTAPLNIGSVTIRLAPGANALGVEFANIAIGDTRADNVMLGAARQVTGTDGGFSFELLPSGSYAMTATRAATDAGNAVTSADALAALRIAVAINPNTDPDGSGPLQALKVSPYQVIAADANSDGKVTSADALAILRMAVKIASAPAQQWDFVSESLDLWNEATGSSSLTRTSAAYDHALNAQLLQDTTANLVGVLRGDVNGSWTPPAGSVDLDVTRPDYFQLLGAQLGVPTDVWGV